MFRTAVTQNIKFDVVDKHIKMSGEEFVIDKLVKIQRTGYDITKLIGAFFKSAG